MSTRDNIKMFTNDLAKIINDFKNRIRSYVLHDYSAGGENFTGETLESS